MPDRPFPVGALLKETRDLKKRLAFMTCVSRFALSSSGY
jgi:hypothetical protein